MTIAYDIDAGAGIVVVTMSGRVTKDEVLSYIDATKKDPRFRPDLHRLSLATDVEAFPPSSEIRGIAIQMSERSAAGARFAVVADTPLAIGMTNMLFGLAGMLDRVRTFPDRTSAVRWLLAPE